MKEINHTERSSVVCAVETVTDPKNLKTNPNTHTHTSARAPVDNAQKKSCSYSE